MTLGYQHTGLQLMLVLVKHFKKLRELWGTGGGILVNPALIHYLHRSFIEHWPAAVTISESLSEFYSVPYCSRNVTNPHPATLPPLSLGDYWELQKCQKAGAKDNLSPPDHPEQTQETRTYKKLEVTHLESLK